VRLFALFALFGFAACWGGGSRGAGPTAARPQFTSPSKIGDCAADRLDVRDQELDLGTPYREYKRRALEWFVSAQAHKLGDVIVLLVPDVDTHENVQSLEARRFDVRTETWLPATSFHLADHAAMAPRYNDVETGVVRGSVIVKWHDLARRDFARRLSTSTGEWTEVDPNIQLPPKNHLVKHPAYPPQPDPTTGVKLEIDSEHRLATFSRGGQRFGTITFGPHPGTYLGAFGNTRTAFLWNSYPEQMQQGFATADRTESYLVSLETGATCRVTRPLVRPATAVFRTRNAIVLFNIHMTEQERSHCPPGAPCLAPESPHLDHASLTVLRDGGN
jgi:hypothetical protein